jgi:hypothetical protein
LLAAPYPSRLAAATSQRNFFRLSKRAPARRINSAMGKLWPNCVSRRRAPAIFSAADCTACPWWRVAFGPQAF